MRLGERDLFGFLQVSGGHFFHQCGEVGAGCLRSVAVPSQHRSAVRRAFGACIEGAPPLYGQGLGQAKRFQHVLAGSEESQQNAGTFSDFENGCGRRVGILENDIDLALAQCERQCAV